ncbi:gamma-glutamylcyclotransferase family protein [Echinicola sp. 20G]|uniref:gamma-glutamylcyclotransferase family protein n=1 Tax=Echinicola sp. 20G TaxID=2781961 RepID=UPI00190FE5BD|nr:gamma-glutamylcyclotransferase family protein [Echinicola sp. 20G]
MASIYYFGYASNLDQSTLVGRLVTPPKFIGIGILTGYGFRFNHPNPDGSARANIVESANENVYGALYQINEKDKNHFLTSEKNYDFTSVNIITKEGTTRAFTFKSSQNVDKIFPHKDYINTIIKGGKAIGIPNTYLTSILNRKPVKVLF